MKLPARLEYVFSLAEKSALTIDVGADHGKLAAALVLSGRAERVIASDVKEGPLSKAEELIAKLGLADKVELRLGDGLRGLETSGADQAVIAGMGGELIASIVAASPWVKAAGVHLVLQPMTTSPELRRFLCEDGFGILRQGAVLEGGRPYEVFAARYTGEKRACAAEEAEIGGAFEGDPEAVAALLSKKRAALQKRLIGAERNDPGEAEIIKRLVAEIDRRMEE